MTFHKKWTRAQYRGQSQAASSLVTGVVAVDVEAEHLHAECLRKRRRKAVTARRGRAKAATGIHELARGTELENLWALAAHLHRALRDGYLYRLRNAPPSEEQPRKRRPAGLLDKPALRLLVALLTAEKPRRAHHARIKIERYNQATKQEMATIPSGLMAYQVKQATRSMKAPRVLVDRGLAEYTDLVQYDHFGHYGDHRPLLHVTQAGRDHFTEHRTAYAEFHPAVPLPARAAQADGSGHPCPPSRPVCPAAPPATVHRPWCRPARTGPHSPLPCRAGWCHGSGGPGAGEGPRQPPAPATHPLE
ncbi:hypothetical protein OH738_40185 (plasmid) [Streptomyces hirsutus]|uniref:hypothetical protein n=1 Tax=Streptomyces hirsutus TaxID=35620 RepID=UPI002F911A76|nr:hypothetical protein OH738_40185 [Streptomyces hirsutus]